MNGSFVAKQTKGRYNVRYKARFHARENTAQLLKRQRL